MGSFLTFAFPVLLVIWEFFLPMINKYFSGPKPTGSVVFNNEAILDDDKDDDINLCCANNGEKNCGNKKED